MPISRLAVILAAFMLSGLAAIPARAQYVCANGPGPGERRVAAAEWTGGLAAREALARCVHGGN